MNWEANLTETVALILQYAGVIWRVCSLVLHKSTLKIHSTNGRKISAFQRFPSRQSLEISTGAANAPFFALFVNGKIFIFTNTCSRFIMCLQMDWR